MPSALRTFVVATFVHIGNISAVTDPILDPILTEKWQKNNTIFMGFDTIEIELVLVATTI